MSEDPAQAACVVRLAANTVSWQQFENYLTFLQEGAVNAAPTVASQLAADADKCGTQNVAPGLGGAST